MNSRYSNICVLIARSIEDIEDPRGKCTDYRDCDTVKEAKDFARYSLTPAYLESNEMTEPMNVARVIAEEDGREVCISEHWRKGWRPEPVNVEENE